LNKWKYKHKRRQVNEHVSAQSPHRKRPGHDEVDTQFDHAGGGTFHILSLKKAPPTARRHGAAAQAAGGQLRADKETKPAARYRVETFSRSTRTE